MSKTKMIQFVVAAAMACGSMSACDDKGKKDASADAKGDKKEGDKGDDAKGDANADGGDAKAADDTKDGGEAAAGDGTIVGTWNLDPAAMKESDEYKNAPDDQKKMMDAMLGSMEMSMTFGDGTMKMSAKLGGEAKESEGKYTIKNTEGNKITIEGEIDGKKEEQTFTVDGNKLIMEDGGQKMVFIKQ